MPKSLFPPDAVVAARHSTFVDAGDFAADEYRTAGVAGRGQAFQCALAPTFVERAAFRSPIVEVRQQPGTAFVRVTNLLRPDAQFARRAALEQRLNGDSGIAGAGEVVGDNDIGHVVIGIRC